MALRLRPEHPSGLGFRAGESTMNVSAASQTPADLALAVYLEPHAEQRRVLVLSGVDAPLSRHLTALAEHLDVIDPTTRAEASGEVPELPFDDESFDLIVVADAGALPEPRRDALRELRRTLARDGLLAIAVRSDAKGEAEELERLATREFARIKVLAQTPTLGYTLRDTDEPRAELSIDASLLRAQPERSERLVLLASDARPTLEPRLWVQVPSAEMLPARGSDVNPRWVESLRKAEDEARRVLAREAELLRDLSREKKAREVAEAGKERTKALERKLLAIEADYDDAVARVRYFEGLVLEREAHEEADRGRGKDADRETSRLREELARLESKLKAAEAGEGSVASESAEYERRLLELGSELSTALRETKRQEQIARDLLEELRGLEQRALVTVEQDARVAELEAERERAMQRALEAEVARESAQMRVDELRAELEQPPALATPSTALSADFASARAELEAERDRLVHELEALRRHRSDELDAQRQQENEQLAQVSALRGERTGLRLRLDEAESALAAFEQTARDDGRALDTRLSLAEARADAAIEALGAAETSLKSLRSEVDRGDAERGISAPVDGGRTAELEALLERAGHRIESLERELEEADRFAEENADDLNRLDALESELDGTRQKLDQVDDEVRTLQDELFSKKQLLEEREAERAQNDAQVQQLRAQLAQLSGEHGVRLEQLARRESELAAERDDAHAGLAEARAILSHLAARVGADTHDLPAIMHALDQHAAPPSTLDALRKALVEAQAARSDAEYQLSRISLQLEERESRIRQLEDSAHQNLAPPSNNFDPPEV
jgi:SAM-dependent methyltransferase